MSKIDINTDIKDKFISNPSSLSLNEYKFLLGGKIDNLLLYQIRHLLECKKINSTELMTVIFPIAKHDEHLLIIALCLRNGADANLYINVNESGLHILAYLYLLYNKPEDELIKNTIILLLLLSGSDPKSKYNLGINLSVIDYLNKIKVKHILGTNIKKDLDNKLLIKLAILLDKDELINNDNLPIVEIIRDNSINIFKKFYNDKNKNKDNEIKFIQYCIKFVNLKIFIILLNLGIYPSYNEINIIILHILTSNHMIREAFNNFLIEYIKRNGRLDSFQTKVIEINQKTIDINEFLNVIGNTFNEDNYKVKKVDFIKKKYIGKNKNFGIDARLESVRVYEESNCLDTFQYNDVLLTSDTYENILATGKCPYKDNQLPTEILDQIAIRRGLLKRLGYKISKIENAVTIDDHYNKLELAFIELIKLNCNKDVTTLPLNVVQRILTSMGVSVDLMNLLSVEHYKRTFYITCYEKLKNNFEETIKLFN